MKFLHSVGLIDIYFANTLINTHAPLSLTPICLTYPTPLPFIPRFLIYIGLTLLSYKEGQ
jgi:hypothetical protein